MSKYTIMLGAAFAATVAALLYFGPADPRPSLFRKSGRRNGKATRLSSFAEAESGSEAFIPAKPPTPPAAGGSVTGAGSPFGPQGGYTRRMFDTPPITVNITGYRPAEVDALLLRERHRLGASVVDTRPFLLHGPISA